MIDLTQRFRGLSLSGITVLKLLSIWMQFYHTAVGLWCYTLGLSHYLWNSNSNSTRGWITLSTCLMAICSKFTTDEPVHLDRGVYTLSQFLAHCQIYSTIVAQFGKNLIPYDTVISKMYGRMIYTSFGVTQSYNIIASLGILCAL